MELLTEFLRGLSSDQTRRAYETDLTRFLTHLGADLSEDALDRVEARDVQRFLQAMKTKELSYATRRRRLSALRRWYDWLRERGIVSHNPARASSVTLDREGESDSSDLRFLSKQELERLVSVAAEPARVGPRDRALVLVIVYGALRRSEVASLEVKHVRPLGRHWVLDLPRGDNRRGGFVKIPAVVAEAVERAVDSYEAREGALWRSFSNRNRGERLSADALYKRVRRLGENADLGTVDIELLRRSGLRLAFQAGARPAQVQDQARLQDPTSAVRYFDSEPGEARLQDAAGDYIDLDIELE